MSWRGIFVIVGTPYTPDFALDEESLRRQVQFCIECGAHGLVGPAFASEFTLLSDEERKRWIEIVVSEASGQIPVVATTHQVHTVPAVAFSRWAEKIGADGVMNMPPHVVHIPAERCYDHYKAISDAVDVPVIIQNMIGPVGTPLGSEMLARMCRELANVQYIKEETLPEPRKIEQTIAAAGDACAGVFGGRGASHLIDEYKRGACGNMPGVSVPDLHVRVWDRLEAGDEEGARQLFNQLMPLFNLEKLYGAAVLKELLYRRGVFAHRTTRMPAGPLWESDQAEVDAVWAQIEPLLA